MGFWKKLFGGGDDNQPKNEEVKETTAPESAAPAPAEAKSEPAPAPAQAEPAAEAAAEPAKVEEAEDTPAAVPASAAASLQAEPVNTNGSVLVVAEVSDGALNPGSLSAVTLARQIAELDGVPFNTLVVGSGVSGVAEELRGYGEASVQVVDNDGLANYLAAPFASAISGVARELGASFVVGVASTFGKDLLPRVAVRLGAGMISEALELRDKENDKHVFRRPMWAGNVLADVQCVTDVTVVSIRGTDFDKAEKAGDAADVVTAGVDVAVTGNEQFVEFAKTESERPQLTEASVVVAGGRGLKDGENFYKVMEPLADSMDAAIGASRAAVDADFCPNDLQIGQTGKVVAPDLYVAVAISGAIQHLAGMKNAKTIVAINKDEEAPIFQVADYGLIADAFTASPEFADKVKSAKA